jgi:hypothetical protein
MGWFSKAKASGHFGALRGAIAEKLRVRLAPGTEEVFEIIDDLWRKLMEENGRQMLSLRPFSMAYTIYPALPEVSADKRPDILAGMIAFLLIKDFKETKHAHELDYILAPLQTTFQREGSSSLDNSFRKLNPRSYAAIVAEYGQGPFARLASNFNLAAAGFGNVGNSRDDEPNR